MICRMFSNFVLLFLLFRTSIAQIRSKPSICSLLEFTNDCHQLDRTNDVKCDTYAHRIDCILGIESRNTTFGRITAEEAAIAANYVQNVMVLGEFRTNTRFEANSTFETVILVKNGTIHGMQDLRGKKFCHPGFSDQMTVTGLMLQEFERKVLDTNKVNICGTDSTTLLEKHIRALSDFLGPSCRPGPWTEDLNLDRSLKSKYSNLCNLCQSSNSEDKCSITVKDMFLEPIECLVNNGGDLALTSSFTAESYFNQTQNWMKRHDYQYLCPDNTVRNSSINCTWTRQPWDLIIANKDDAVFIKDKLNEWLKNFTVKTVERSLSAPALGYFQNIFFPEDKEQNKVVFLNTPLDLNTYMKQYRQIPDLNSSKQCNTDLKWCTISGAEQKKCQWLGQASLNKGIQPVIDCSPIINVDKLQCLNSITNKNADIVMIDASYGYVAQKMNLTSIAFPETASRNLIKSLVVIKDTDKNHLTTFENLRDKMSCFPQFGGIEWITWIDVARERGILSKDSCDYGKLFSDFVGDSCVPGALDVRYKPSDNTDKEKLCRLCQPSITSRTAVNCNANEENEFYGNVGALKCLNSSGDFAVITYGDDYGVEELNFRVLCRNGSLSSYAGFNVDDNCALAVITDSEVVSRKNSIKNDDIKLVLLQFEKFFGTDKHKPFDLYNVFNNTPNLLFKESTVGIDLDRYENEHVQNYVNLFTRMEQCVVDEKGTGSSITPIFVLLLTTMLLQLKLQLQTN